MNDQIEYAPLHQQKSKRLSDNTNNAAKKFDHTAIADLLRTVSWVTTANEVVWLTGLRAQTSHSPQQPFNQKDTHLKIYK